MSIETNTNAVLDNNFGVQYDPSIPFPRVQFVEDNLGFVTKDLAYDADRQTWLNPEEANASEDNRVLWCTSLAAISRGKTISNNPTARYNLLRKEAAPFPTWFGNKQTPSRPLEFIPVVLTVRDRTEHGIKMSTYYEIDLKTTKKTMDRSEFFNRLLRFSYCETIDSNLFLVYTNMRAVLNAGIPYEEVPYNTPEECKGFKAVMVTCPMFVFNHLITHTAFSKESRSERVTDVSQIKYWRPNEISEERFKSMLELESQKDIWESLKAEGYKKEIYQRALLEWRYKSFVMVAWSNEYTWQHLFLERSAIEEVYKNWTQEETKKVVKTIKSVIEG